MRKLFLVLLLISFSIPAIAQENHDDAFFYDLVGIEDSADGTHLYYRLYESRIGTCTFSNGEGGYDSTDLTLYNNHIYHFNTISSQDSLYLEDYFTVQGQCGTSNVSVEGFTFSNNNPGEVYSIQLKNFGQVEPSTYLYNPEGDQLEISLLTDFYRRIAFDISANTLLFTYIDVFSSEYEEITIRISDEDSVWKEGHLHQDYIDSSNTLQFQLLDINPFNNHYVGFKNDSITVSTDNGRTFNNLFPFQTPAGIQNVKKPLFDPDSTTFYLKRKVTHSIMNLDNDFLFRLRLENDNSTIDTLWIDKKPFFATTDDSNTGHLYVSASTDVLFSDNFGDSFSTFFTTENEITGLYKKPESKILYVLTSDELLEVDVETGEFTSLKQLPVSNEQEPAELPAEITLDQNYPNPFNPSTNIQFTLSQSSHVKLEVFNSTGKLVSTLLDQPKTGGKHSVQFDASNLSSGLYFYRLITSGKQLTRKFIFVK